MNDFHKQLEKALKRTTAPAGFEARLATRIQNLKRRRLGRRFAAAAAILIVLTTGIYLENYRREQQIQVIRKQVALGLQITAQELRSVREKISNNIPVLNPSEDDARQEQNSRERE